MKVQQTWWDADGVTKGKKQGIAEQRALFMKTLDPGVVETPVLRVSAQEDMFGLHVYLMPAGMPAVVLARVSHVTSASCVKLGLVDEESWK